MQGDHHLDGAGHHAAYIATFEHQPRMFQALGRRVTQLDHVLTQLDPRHLRLALQGVTQVIVDGEGQVALARAEVGHPQGLIGGQRRRVQGMGKHFDELVDLFPLARHRRDQRLLLVGDAQVMQERTAQFQVTLFLPVMFAGRCLTLLLHGAAMQHRLALLAELQLRFVAQAQQVGIAERTRQQLGDQRQGLVIGQVAGDVTGLVAVHKRQASLALDGQGFGDDPLQGFFSADMARQHQFDQGILLQAGGEQAQKLRTRIRRGLGGGGIGHREWVPRVAEGAARRNAGYFTWMTGLRTAFVDQRSPLKPGPPDGWAARCAHGSRARAGSADRHRPRYR
ncbi:hypothetical protein D3C80_888800 [compost metagenome]